MTVDAISSLRLTAVCYWLLACIGAPSALAEASSETKNPITRLARMVNPKLAKVENRVRWLDRQVASLARYDQYPLKYGLGYRGCRPSQSAPDPTVTMDLGAVMPIDKIYLVPAQREHLKDAGIFPKKFTITVAKTANFEDSEDIYRTATGTHVQVGGIPTAFSSSLEARYIRITVMMGRDEGALDVFGFSEFFVISGGYPVSFNSRIETTGSQNITNLWYPEALIDGRTPLGVWHHGLRTLKSFGDAVLIGQQNAEAVWNTPFKETAKVNLITLFPFQFNQSRDTSILPQGMRIELAAAEGEPPVWSHEWRNPIPGTLQMTPLVFPVPDIEAGHISITAIEPWSMGNRHIHALSEIQVRSGKRNIVAGQPTTRYFDGNATRITSLTDNYSSEKKIAPLAIWLDQLIKRGRIEAELAILKSIYGQLASRSEVNVSWGSAVLLGLTFLIPVFIVERKRMRSREHLDIIRKRIASDLHDDIGSNLGSISLIARTARKDLARLNGPVEIDNDLGEVEMIARESSLAMRDIVWLLERKQDSIGDLVHRMRETAGRLLRETQFTMECTSSKTASKLTLDAKRHLFLFYKEAIHNIIKHSKASRVSMRLWDEGDQLVMEVLDNGVGLPINKDRTSVSVKKLEDRAEVLNGILQVTSSPETGTCIRLLVKRSQLTSNPKAS